ncbi:MAG: hypothetical protein HQ547_02980 [Candidatus Omnitrophica bacterium]|nr:hypothetical protein [Candidatus Omnitrophota bacterium]
MSFRKTYLCRIISLLVVFSFLLTNPTQASLAGMMETSQSQSPELKVEGDLSISRQIKITDPEKIIIAESAGRVHEIFKGNKSRLVINIQDAHCNFEAQSNISQILDTLVNENGLRFIGLEGSTGEIDPSLFTAFPDKDIRREVATYFMKKGKINGAEFLAITSKNPPQLYGVETKEYYLANLASFTNTLADREAMISACDNVKRVLGKFKERIYSKTLKRLDAKAAAYQNEKINLIDYCNYLRKLAKSKKVPVEEFANLKLLYKTIDIEKKINFNQVDRERSDVISILEKILSKKELEELLTQSTSFQSNRIGAAVYYAYLRNLSYVKKIDLHKYPNLSHYITYLMIYERIDNLGLLEEMVALEDLIKEGLFANEDQRTLAKLLKHIQLLENMLDISMSKKDVEYYTNNKTNFRSAVFIDFINSKAKKYRIPYRPDPNFSLIDKHLPDLEDFYRIADTRDDAIIENTIKKMDESNVDVMALITGGYHTKGITERLRGRGISYVVISPRITSHSTENPYLKILSGTKIPYVKKFSTDRNELAITSLLAKDSPVASEAIVDFNTQVALLFLSGFVYKLKQEDPNISSADLTQRLNEARDTWFSGYVGSLRHDQAENLRAALGSLTFDIDNLLVDRTGRYYIPITIAGEKRIIRYFNLEEAPADIEVDPDVVGEQENVGLQILTEAQYARVVEASGIQVTRGEAQAPKTLVAEADSALFKREFEAWSRTAKGRRATRQERVDKLAELFVKSMHGLRGSPDNWLLEIVAALNPGNTALQATARKEWDRLNRRLAEACGPQALHDALHNPQHASPLFTGRYSSPSHVSNDISALFLTAIDMSESEGKVAHIDAEGRLYHTAFALAELGELIGVGMAPTANGFELLRHLATGQQRFIAHVKRNASDPEGNHYVEVESISESEITYRDNGIQQTEPIGDFIQRWTGNILVNGELGDELKLLQPVMQARDAGFRLLEGADLKRIRGACGIITTIGAGFGKHLGSMRQMEYRGSDDVGISTNDEFGTRVNKVMGGSEEMARAIYMRGQGLEERAMHYLYENREAVVSDCEDPQLEIALLKLYDHKPLTDQDLAALHEKWRNLNRKERQEINRRVTAARQTLRTHQNIAVTAHSDFSAPEMYTRELDAAGHVVKNKAIGVGQMGFSPVGLAVDFFGGREYKIRNNIPALVRRLKDKHQLDIEYIKYFIKFELEEAITAAEQAMGQHPEHIEAKIAELVMTYERVIDRVIRGEEVPAGDQVRWDAIKQFLNGRFVRVPAIFSLDPVRHLFRLQSSLIGTFTVRTEDRGEVEKNYRTLLRTKGVKDWRTKDWFTDWREEARLNMVGRASEALTIWFQRESVVPANPGNAKIAVIRKYGIELGTLDSITLGYMSNIDYIGGHDRWATTGSNEKKDGQPHTDTGRVSGLRASAIASIVKDLPTHNGDGGQPLSSRERLQECLKRAKALPAEERGRATRIMAHNGDLNPNIVAAMVEFLEARGYDFMTEDGERILTDTKALIVFWEYVRDAAALDSMAISGEESRRSDETQEYTDTDSPHNFLEGNVQIATGEEMTLAALWNEIVKTSKKTRFMSPDEIALRVALTVFGPESEISEIAADVRSLHMPDKHIIVSHERPLYVVIRTEVVKGKVVDAKYQVTSDPSSALRLWDTQQIDADVRDLNQIDEDGMAAVDEARAARDAALEVLAGKQAELGASYEPQVAQAIEAFNIRVREIDKEVETKKDVIRNKYSARVVTLKGKQKVVSISKRLNEATDDWEVNLEYTKFLGTPIDPTTTDEIKDEEDLIPIDIADKGKFRTYAEKHINEIPWIVLRSVANYIQPDGTVDMSMEKVKGVFKRYGIDIDELKARFGENLEGLERMFITGIGSSERDAKCVQRLFKTLLPGVEIIPVGPGHLVSTNQHYDEKHDFVVGISWSGSTALTLDALTQAKDSHGVCTASLTGKPKSDIGTLTADSAGTIHVKTGEERAVFTTKGFLGILFDLGILGVQLSQMRDGALQEEQRQQVQAERMTIVQQQQQMPEILTAQVRDPQLDPEDPNSWIMAEGKRYRNGSGALVFGSKHNNPIIEEGELKWEETRWILGKAYDYGEDTAWNLLEFIAKNKLRWPIVIQVTDPTRFDEALALIRRCKELGLDFIVQTFNEDDFEGDEKNEFWEQLQTLKQEAGIDPVAEGGDGRDRVQIFGVDRVHPALQAVVDATFFFKSAVAFARQAGLSDTEIDSSRNLAKSVTVKGIKVPGVLYEMFQYMSELQGVAIEELVVQHQQAIAAYWATLAKSIDKAIARLPLVYDNVTRRCLPNTVGGMAGYSTFNDSAIKQFGPENIKKVVVITEEVVDGNTAAIMAAGPLGHADFRITGAGLFDRPKDPATGTPMETQTVGNVAVNGEYYTVTFNFRTRNFYIQKTKHGQPIGGPIEINGIGEDGVKKVKGEDQLIEFATVDEGQFSREFQQQLKAFFDGREYKITANKTQGLVFEAVKPTLAGVNVIVHNPRDYDLASDIDENTVVVVLRRSNNRPWGRNAEIPDIEDPVEGRNADQQAVPGDAIGEELILQVLEENVPEGTPIFAITDGRSPGVLAYGNNSFGSIVLPNDLDATSTTGMYYMSLMSFGVYLGWQKGSLNMKDYEVGLTSARELSRQVVTNEAQIGRLRQRLVDLRRNKFDMQHRTVQIIGGGQDYASALVWGSMLHRIAGVEAEALPVDESVHGPLAAVWNTVKKFLDQINKAGRNSEFTPHPTEAPASKYQDALVVVLGTDSRTLTAAVVDANRNDTRAASLIVVVKESDVQDGAEAKPAVDFLENRGALILTIPDSPNELTNFSQMTLATIFANELNRSTSSEFSFARLTAGTPVVEAAVAMPPAERAERMAKLNLTDNGHYYETQQGGMIAKDVDLRNIDETAFIGSGSIVTGMKTVIGSDVRISENSVVANSIVEQGAQIKRSKLDDVDVEKRAIISDSTLKTVEKKKKWGYADSEYRVANDRTVIETEAKVTGQSNLINTRVGKGSVVEESDVSHSEIGRQCNIVRAKVELVHAEDLVNIIGPTEVAESWLGWGLEIKRMAFVTGVFTNKVLALDLQGDNVVPEFIEGLPNVSPVGEYAIFSDYQGEKAVAQGDYVTRITGVGDISDHGTVFVKPSCIIAPDTRIIALSRQLDLTTWEHAMEPNLTVINPFSVAAHQGREVWGQILPGEARHGLSPRDTTPGWTFTYSPHAIIRMMENMVTKVHAKAKLDDTDPDEVLKVLDDFPEKMLRTGMVICTKALSALEPLIAAEGDGSEAKAKLEARRDTLQQALALYKTHLDSRAWEFRNGKFISEWNYDAATAMYTSDRCKPLLTKLIADGLIANHHQYAQTMMPQILDVRRQGVAREPIRTDIVKTQALRSRTQITYVDAAVEVHPTARLLPGTRLTGNTVIGPGVTVWGSHLDNVTVGANSEIENCVGENVTIGENNKHSNSRIRNSQLGDDVTSSHNLIERNTAADGTKFEPRAVVVGGRSAGTIGSPFIDSTVGTELTNGATGLADHHMATAIRNTDFPEIKAEIDGETVYVANVANIGGGSTIGITGAKERVVIESAFIASDTDIAAGARVGFCAYVKNGIRKDENVLAFTFKNGPGLENDEIGGVLDMPGVIFRHLISKTKAAMPEDQRHLVDKLMVAKIKEALEICQAMLADPDQNPGYTQEQLERGIARFTTHLSEGRWEMANDEFTKGRWLRLSPEGAGKVEYQWVPNGKPKQPAAGAAGLDDLGKGPEQTAENI